MDPASSQTEIISNSSLRRRRLRRRTAERLNNFRDRSEVSLAIKYFLFAFNILFWSRVAQSAYYSRRQCLLYIFWFLIKVSGSLLLAVGLYAVAERTSASNFGALTFINPVLLLLISGSVVFCIGFFGCIGALRENRYLVLVYVICVGIIFVLLVSAAVIMFAFRDWVVHQLLIHPLQSTITSYSDDADLQNLIDWVQSDWLQCCGLNDYNDWEENVYFNCSSPGVQACGVPFSCCLPSTDPNILGHNLECGYNVRRNAYGNDPGTIIYTKGCIEKGELWFQLYMIPVAGVIVGTALIQIIGMCCAWNLYADIGRQRAKWKKLQAPVLTTE